MSTETGQPALPDTGPSQQQQQHQQEVGSESHAAELFSRLQSQVEFYFSQQNLARDTYLRNMLTSEHPDMPTPRPAQFMCPVGIVTSFPKVRDICAQFGESSEPPALLLGKALEGSNIVSISSDGNWIGPLMQQMPPPMMGGPPPRAPNLQQQPQFQQGPYPPNQFQQGPFPPNVHQPSMMMPPIPIQQGEGGVALQYQHPHSAPISLVGSESPSSASIESMPSQQQAHQAASKDVVYVAVMDLPSEVNPIEILSALTTELIRPKSAFVNGNTGIWFVAFSTEGDAKGAIQASKESTISGMPILAKLNSELPASSKLSIAPASVASLSSMSASGGQMIQQQQPVPLMGPGGVYPLPPGPSPLHPMLTQNIMPGPYPGGPQYGMSPQMQSQLAGMPPGQPYMQPYYNPQQMQQVYPGNYMQPQGPYPPPPPPPQMGNRYGMAPPPPRGYPGGPPPPYPQYQGMPQYMGEGYGYYQRQGNPPPHRQYNDRQQGGPGVGGGGGFHDHKKRNDGNKKKKNKNHQHQGGRDSYGSGTPGNNGQQQRNSEYGNYGHHQSRHDNSTSPVPSDNQGKWKSKREHGEQFRRNQGNGSPASFNRHYNRQHRNDRLSSSDTSPSSFGRQQGKVDDKDLFSTSDFPGLGGGINDEESEKALQQGHKLNNNLVGYASALLKKREAENKKEADSAAPTVATDNEVDSITRQTEEMEREILSEFHDLSLIGDGNSNGVALSSPGKNQQGPHHSIDLDDKVEGQTVGTASFSTIDARSLPNNPLPILPGSFPENDAINVPKEYSSDSLKQQPPTVDVTSSEDFPSRDSANIDVVGPSPVQGQTAPDNVEDPKPPGVWGGKRFADVI